MSERFKKIRRIIVIVCIVILMIDITYLGYKKLIDKPKQTYFDSINSFELLEDGYIAVGSNNNNENGYEKAKITKYNLNKEKVWEKLYNKKYNSNYFGIKKDDKYYIAVGDYESTKSEYESKTRSAIIVKYDLEGNIVKEKKFQVLGNSKFTNILVVEDGYIVVGQSIYENMTLGLSDEGGAFLIKYDKDLNEVWKSNYGGSKSGIYHDVIILDNYIYAVGKDSVRTGILSKYNLNGERITTVNYDNTDTLGFTSIVTIDSNLYVVGSKTIKDLDTDALIVKYDINCNKIDEKTYTGKGIERYNKAIADKNNIVIAGQTGTLDKEKSTNEKNTFSYDGIFAKYNKEMEEQVIEQYGDEKEDYFTDIKKRNNQYIISGYSSYEENNYLSKFIIYTSNGKLIGAES